MPPFGDPADAGSPLPHQTVPLPRCHRFQVSGVGISSVWRRASGFRCEGPGENRGQGLVS